jgi:hypothetical protein
MAINTLNPADIALHRLVSQNLVGSSLTTPREVVASMAAMQAQDFPMAKWAVGVRLPRSTEQDIEAAIAKGAIIRTHLLRPTWHFVSSEDIYWLLDLSAAHLRAVQSSREKQLGLTSEVFSNSNGVIEKALADGRPRTREELINALNLAGIPTDENRASHLLGRAELEKIICSGPTQNNKPTYTLLSLWVPQVRNLSHEEALAVLARRYFTSRSPASIQDFSWWSGLPAREAALALELVKADFISESVEGRTYWLKPGMEIKNPSLNWAFLLPNFDEFTLSYAVRSASIDVPLEQHMKQISDRGVFRPIVVINGQVQGTWKRTIKKDLVSVEIRLFSPLGSEVEMLINQAAEQYASFLTKKLSFSLSIE